MELAAGKGSRSTHLSCCPASHITNSDAKCNPASVKTVALVCHHSLFAVQLLNDRMWEMKSFLCPRRLFKIKIPEWWRGRRCLRGNSGSQRRDTAWMERAFPQQGSGDGGFALSFKNNLLCKSRQYVCLSLLCLHYTSGTAASAWCLAEWDPCLIGRNEKYKTNAMDLCGAASLQNAPWPIELANVTY